MVTCFPMDKMVSYDVCNRNLHSLEMGQSRPYCKHVRIALLNSYSQETLLIEKLLSVQEKFLVPYTHIPENYPYPQLMSDLLIHTPDLNLLSNVPLEC